MGRIVKKGYKIWEWRYDIDGAWRYHLNGTVMDVHAPPVGAGEMWQPNCWTCIETNQLSQDIGCICTTGDIPGGE